MTDRLRALGLGQDQDTKTFYPLLHCLREGCMLAFGAKPCHAPDDCTCGCVKEETKRKRAAPQPWEKAA